MPLGCYLTPLSPRMVYWEVSTVTYKCIVIYCANDSAVNHDAGSGFAPGRRTTPRWGMKPHHARHGTREGRESTWRRSPEGRVKPSWAQPRWDRPAGNGDLQYSGHVDRQTRSGGAKPTQLHLSHTFLERLGNAVPCQASFTLRSPACATPQQTSPR